MTCYSFCKLIWMWREKKIFLILIFFYSCLFFTQKMIKKIEIWREENFLSSFCLHHFILERLYLQIIGIIDRKFFSHDSREFYSKAILYEKVSGINFTKWWSKKTFFTSNFGKTSRHSLKGNFSIFGNVTNFSFNKFFIFLCNWLH